MWMRRPAWQISGWLLLLLALVGLYEPVVRRLIEQWWDDPNDSYGFLIPIFCGWLFWRRREGWRKLPLAPANAGYAWIALALGMLLLGRLGSELLLTRLSLVLMLAGLILTLQGRVRLRYLGFPLGFLCFMIPLPTLIYNQVTLPLQSLATRTGDWLLAATGIPVLRQGNLIVLPAAVLDVIAACSGIRSLLALLALATGYGYLMEPVIWRRWVLIAAMIPLAVISNGLRIALTGLLTYWIGAAASHGLWHLLTGMQVFVVAVLGMVLLQRLLARLPSREPRHA